MLNQNGNCLQYNFLLAGAAVGILAKYGNAYHNILRRSQLPCTIILLVLSFVVGAFVEACSTSLLFFTKLSGCFDM